MHLIVGLGNPEPIYDKTRHNLGFIVVKAFGAKLTASWTKQKHFFSEMATIHLAEKKVLLALPLTYMNQSGKAVKSIVDYFNVGLESVLIVCDDADLPFGRLRLRDKGGSGGHNGLKSIEEQLNSSTYSRLRLGIGRMAQGLVDHVLGKFTSEEEKALPLVVEEAKVVIELFITQGFQKATARASNFHIGEKENVES